MNTKLVMVFCSGSNLEPVRRLIDEHEVHGYNEIPDVPGSGATGRHMGTRAWPGASAIVLTAVESAKASELVTALADFARGCAPEEGLRVLVLPVEQMI